MQLNLVWSVWSTVWAHTDWSHTPTVHFFSLDLPRFDLFIRANRGFWSARSSQWHPSPSPSSLTGRHCASFEIFPRQITFSNFTARYPAPSFSYPSTSLRPTLLFLITSYPSLSYYLQISAGCHQSNCFWWKLCGSIRGFPRHPSANPRHPILYLPLSIARFWPPSWTSPG